MVRRLLIAGNWKMNTTVTEALALVRELLPLVAAVTDRDMMIAPPYVSLWPVGQQLSEQDSNIQLGAQELYPKNKGAFTGAISGGMLKELGCTHVLVGHSERRQLFGETLASSKARVGAALEAGLRPMLCIGETLTEREAGSTFDVVSKQLEAGLNGLSVESLAKLTLAYEPVWAIGTGKVATTGEAQEVHAHIRERLSHIDAGVANSMRILYGGSVKPGNAKDLLAQEDIDGALVGGASLTAESFAAIIRA